MKGGDMLIITGAGITLAILSAFAIVHMMRSTITVRSWPEDGMVADADMSAADDARFNTDPEHLARW